jgi:MFS family permease
MKNSYKWLLVALLSCAFFFHQADRALFGLLTIPIQDELKLTGGQMGWINGALFGTLAIMTPIAGFCGDRFSRKWLITGSLIFWSLMTACMGFVGDFRVLGLVIPAFLSVMFFRSIATGGGESFYAPSAYALIATHHKETRSVALSIHQAALYIGLMTSGALVAWILHALKGSAWVERHFGGLGYWRPVFIIFGALGFLLGVLFIFSLKETTSSGKSIEAKVSPAEKPPLMEGLKAFFCNPSALLATGGFIAIVVVNNVYMSWAPKFVAEKFAAEYGDKTVAVASAGNGTMLWHHVFAFAAIMAGGFLTDAFVKRYPRFRLLVQGVALLLGAPMLAWFGFAPSLVSTWASVAAYGVFRGLFEVNTHASLFDVVAPKYRSTAVGLMTMLAFFLGALAPILMGYLYDARGVRGFEIGFAILGGVYAVGAVLMALSFFFTFRRDRVVER